MWTTRLLASGAIVARMTSYAGANATAGDTRIEIDSVAPSVVVAAMISPHRPRSATDISSLRLEQRLLHVGPACN